MKFLIPKHCMMRLMSHPARGAWIEIRHFSRICAMVLVAPRKGCVD